MSGHSKWSTIKHKKAATAVVYRSSTSVDLGDKGKMVENLLEQLEATDDVQGVYANN